MSGLIIIQWIARLILVLLFGLSIWSIAIMIDRYRAFRQLKASRDTEKVKEMLRQGNLESLARWVAPREDLESGVLKVAMELQGKSTEAIDRAVKSYLTETRTKLEKGLNVLATLGANAPFIGLFGTVLGIIFAFGELGANANGTEGVMTGISEALIATAVGLFVAIPAVVAYNIFLKQLKGILTDCEAIRDLYVARYGRQ